MRIASTLVVIWLAASPSSAEEASKRSILIVASSANELVFQDGRTHPTGYFLGELSTQAQAFIEAGYEVVVATPDGNTPAVDGNSIWAGLFDDDAERLDQAMRFVLTHPSMQRPALLSDVVESRLAEFDAIYVPGGHAPMVDLMTDPDLATALNHFHTEGKVTAMLCHGPIAATANVADPDGFRAALVAGDLEGAAASADGWPYAGYRMTVYSTAEEIPTEEFIGGKIEFYMEDGLRAAGAEVSTASPDEPYIVVDRELITGQNPYSDHILAQAVIDALAEQTD